MHPFPHRPSTAIAILAAVLMELVPAAHAQILSFTDVTESAGVQTTQDFGFDLGSSFMMGGGAVGDFDGDGLQDLFVLSGKAGGRPDRLYLNDGDGTFTDRATAWGLTDVHEGKGVAVGDYDDDGWLDLYVTSAGPDAGGSPGQHRLYRNVGGTGFVDVAAAAGVRFTAPEQEDGWGAAFGDYDLDGDLDLFVAGQALDNAGNRLFRNDGDGTFTDVTQSIALFDGSPTTVYGFAPRFADMDGDRFPELLLAADFGTGRYFRNDGDGTFTDVTETSGTGLEENAMGQVVADLDQDGLPDWYVSSIHQDGAGLTGNKLYRCVGPHVFVEDAKPSGVDDGGWGWGVVAVDFDHDGLVDLAETNGDGSGSGPFFQEQSYLWRNLGDGTFQEIALSVGFAHFGEGRGLVTFDYDEDGDQDVVIFANREPITLLRNDLSGPDAHWLRVFLDTRNLGAATDLPPHGLGARLVATAGTITWTRQVLGGDHYLSHGELSAHFGLGAVTQLDALRVEWPNGETTEQTDVPADQTLRLAAPSSWSDLGNAKPGTYGDPSLDAQGKLLPGAPFTLSIANGLEGSIATLVVGTSTVNLPVLGGVLVPAPDVVIAGLPLDRNGALAIGANWPATAPSGSTLYLQAWILDPGAAGGVSATNAIAGTTE